ncbi:MAG: GNAT family N-acetyltransferase [Pseudomonadota bacterium]
MTVLQTDRLVLRGPVASDLPAMFAVYRDPLAMRYWSTPPHADLSVTQDLLNRRIAAWEQAPLNFQITLNDQYIGNAGNFAATEIGYMLARQYWRQGILTEAMTAIIPHLFAVTDFAALTADVDPRNAASIALLEKLGFAETHRAQNTFCIDGEWSDSIYFALPRHG